MQIPVFQLSPPRQPLALASGKTSELFRFEVFPQFGQMFIRVIALWTDNTALGGPAPTIQLKSADGVITSVKADVGEVEIPNQDGLAGVASCQGLPGDTYLVTLGEMSDSSEPWSLRIKNNADKTLRFAWVSAPEEQNTLRPWLALGSGERDASGVAQFSVTARTVDQFMPVRNWGTATATLEDVVGLPLGGQQSPVVLSSRPDSIAPHGVDHIGLRCEQAGSQAEFSHVFSSNDLDPAHTTLRLTVMPGQ